jgi:DNA repair exonuclease SbcCD nuclease subunit
VKVLFLSDTHLGFDEPVRPRSHRPRRGPDFFAVYRQALRTAREEGVDLVVHGGDLFFRSRVPDALIDRAMTPLVDLAAEGTPVFLVPGNHERSRIPRTLFSQHERIHIFSEPRTFTLTVRGMRVAVGGFPFAREEAGRRFPELLAATGIAAAPADLRLFCMHQIVEGARVGPAGYMFRDGDDVVRAADLPDNVSVVLCGHVHRHQVLRTDLRRAPLPAPVVYAGSTERTSFAEMEETKGCVVLQAGDGLCSMRFRPLPARAMYSRTLAAGPLDSALRKLAASLQGIHPSGILRVRVPEGLAAEPGRIAAGVKTVVPPTMILSFRFAAEPGRSFRRDGN